MITKMTTKDKVYWAIVDWMAGTGMAPTYREIANLAGCSHSAAHRYVMRLIEDERVGYFEGLSRALWLLNEDGTRMTDEQVRRLKHGEET